MYFAVIVDVPFVIVVLVIVPLMPVAMLWLPDPRSRAFVDAPEKVRPPFSTTMALEPQTTLPLVIVTDADERIFVDRVHTPPTPLKASAMVPKLPAVLLLLIVLLPVALNVRVPAVANSKLLDAPIETLP